MSRAVEYLEQELASVRTGRASAGTLSAAAYSKPYAMSADADTLLTHAPSGLLDNLKVQVYGQRMPLRGAANVSVRDAQTLLVTAFDPSVSSVQAALLLVRAQVSQLSTA